MGVLVEHFALDVRAARQLPLFEARYNIAPSQEVLVVRNVDGVREASTMRWGLVPSWSKEPGGGPPMINARAETLAEKPAFRTAYRRRRCIVPADGFYEWKKLGAETGTRGKKQPYYIHRPDGGVFGFAGLWETWRGPGADRGGERRHANGLEEEEEAAAIESCTIVTTDANRTLSDLHDRMPVILAEGDYALWLDRAVEDPEQLRHLLAPCGEDELVAEPVSAYVNRVANDGPQCIAVERSLFE